MSGRNRQFILGEHGGKIIGDTNVHVGDWTAIQMLSDTTFTTLTGANEDAVAGTLNLITFTAGVIIYGHFTAITLLTGAVRAYKVPS